MQCTCPAQYVSCMFAAAVHVSAQRLYKAAVRLGATLEVSFQCPIGMAASEPYMACTGTLGGSQCQSRYLSVN